MLAFLRRAAVYLGRCDFVQRVKTDHFLCHYCAYHPWHVIVENDKRVVARLSLFDQFNSFYDQVYTFLAIASLITRPIQPSQRLAEEHQVDELVIDD